MNRPNILILMTDQQSASAMSCAGNTDLHTPNLDRLAARGVRFDRAYSVSPLCLPFRAAMVTGQYPHRLGCMNNRGRIPHHQVHRTLGRRFRDAGYTTAYAGKWHLPRIDLTDPVDAEAAGFECIAGFNDAAIPPSCSAFLRRPHDRPFLLVASFNNPHNICEHARDQPLPDGEVAPPKADQLPELPPNHAPPSDECSAIDALRPNHTPGSPRHDWPAERWQTYRHTYFRLCEKVDAQIGQVLDALRDAGHADDTLVVFLSDHGDMQGAHGLVVEP